MRKQLIAVAAALLATAPAMASGFSIYEQSAKASGQAGAWVARADDPAANWYNPAALTKLEGTQVQFGFNYIDIGGDTHFTIGQDAAAIGAAAAVGVTVTPGQEFDSESNVAIPSHLYFTGHLNDNWSFGVGLTVPFGLVTEWTDAPLTLISRKADLATLNINPNLAYKINDNWSIAFGINYLYADIKEFSRLPAAQLDGDPELETFEFNLKGNGDDLGWNLAMHYTGADWNFGFTYRSALSPDISGSTEITGAPIPAQTGTTSLDLPDQAAVGVAYTALPNFDIEFDVSWAHWSTFQTLAVNLDGPGLPDIVQAENWSDTVAFRIGGAWKLGESHEIRAGFVRDQNPIPTNTLRPSIPDADRSGLSLGYGFAGKKFVFDAYGMMLQFDDRTSSGIFGNPASPTPYDGVIDGEYTSKVVLLGLTATYKF